MFEHISGHEVFKKAWAEYHQKDPDWAPPPSWQARVRAGCTLADVREQQGRRPPIGSPVPIALRFVLHRQTAENRNSRTQEMAGDIPRAAGVFVKWLRASGVRVLAWRASSEALVAPYVEAGTTQADKLAALMVYAPPVDLTPIIQREARNALVLEVYPPGTDA